MHTDRDRSETGDAEREAEPVGAMPRCSTARATDIIRVGCNSGTGRTDELVAAIKTANRTPSLEQLRAGQMGCRRNRSTDLPDRAPRFPQLRFMGSKYRLLPWLYEVLSDLDFDSALDAFSGSGAVAYLLKTMGKEVTANDFLNLSTTIARAVVENERDEIADMASVRLPTQFVFAVVDGIGWHRRQADLAKIHGFYDQRRMLGMPCVPGGV